MTARCLNLTVMAGGMSAEREVSLRSGVAVVRALRTRGHSVTLLDPQNRHWSLPSKTEVVFLALHGTYGEDGQVQQQLEAFGVPYTGCGPQASRLAFDKVLAKQRFQAARVPTARFVVLDSNTAPWPDGWTTPAVLKPVCQGSSVGLQFVHDPADFPAALSEVLRFDRRALLEVLIEGREMTVAILDGQALPIVEVRPKQGGAYDYHNKYTPGATEYLCPAPVKNTLATQIQQTALAAFGAIEGQDYGRVDLIVQPAGDLVVLEVNTLPGMTETSLFPKAARAAGIEYAELCERMVDLALRRAGHPSIQGGPA